MMRPFSDVDLHAFVDGQINPERRALIETYLRATPSEAARVDQWRRQNETIRSLFAGAATEPVPLWLTIGQVASGRSRATASAADPIQDNRLSRTGDARRPSAAPWRNAAAGRWLRPVALVMLAFAAGAALPYALPEWPQALERWLPATPRNQQLQRLAMRTNDAYRVFGSDPELAVEVADTQRGAVSAWLRRRLSFSVRVPDLSRLGWTLRGGRVVAGDLGPAALMVYENAAGDRISLVEAEVTNPAPADTGFAIANGPTLVWLDGPVGFGIASSREGSWLSDNARSLYRAVYEGAEP